MCLPAPTLLGQGPACDIDLSDRAVSRRHASLELLGRRLRITDSCSRNGTFVDGVAILDAYLLGGELLRIGSTALQVEAEASALPAKIPTSTSFGRLIGRASRCVGCTPSSSGSRTQTCRS